MFNMIAVGVLSAAIAAQAEQPQAAGSSKLITDFTCARSGP
jgi:hypothetical protein